MILITLKFSMLEYEKIKKKNRLTDTAIDLLRLINEFGKWLKKTRVEFIKYSFM